MKRILFSLGLVIAAQCAFAQITITSADMPVINDTLRWSSVSPVGTGINLNDTGTNHNWDYSNLAPLAQGLDQYQSAISVNASWYLIDPAAYGYKVADSLPTGGTIPVTIQNIYTFFKKNGTTSYNAVGFGASISGAPYPAVYTDPDEIYFFPLAYGNTPDTSTYFVTTTVPLLGSWTQSGTRYTKVDGWGTIKTPYFTSPQNCIRVRSEKVETDSVHITFTSQDIKLPFHTVEYKFLVNGQHYPALWVTANVFTDTVTHTDSEAITSVRFKDMYRDSLHPTGIEALTQVETEIGVYPNPAVNGMVYISVPASWQYFTIEIFDMQGKLVNRTNNKRELNLQALPGGEYLGRIISGNSMGFVRITK